ncbi:hypothetical protein ACROYT_G016211 [Oculina patagonica]
MTTRAHSSHQGIDASICIRRAKDTVFWPSMTKDIQEAVVKCEICAEFQAKNVKQPMQTHEIPDRPWSRVSSDLFTLNSKEYNVLTDSYLDFIEVGELKDTTAVSIINFLKEKFSRHCIPDVVLSDCSYLVEVNGGTVRRNLEALRPKYDMQKTDETSVTDARPPSPAPAQTGGQAAQTSTNYSEVTTPVEVSDAQ